MRTDILERKEEILAWIENSESKAFISKMLQCKPSTLESYLSKMDISYDGNKGSKGKIGKEFNRNYKDSTYYIGTDKHITSHKLKNKLIRDGIKKHKCEICEIEEWNNQLIPIELDHINGDHYDNRLENLRIICPNCHAQTPTHAGKNKGINKV